MIEKPNTLEEGANRSYTSGKADDLEHTYSYTSRHSEEHYEETDLQRGTKRGLSARHIQMISLGGAIGRVQQAPLLHTVSAVTIATELAAAATIIRWWKEVMPDAAWSTIFMLIILGINLVGVRIYGELEYWFALIKILIVIVFIIIAILVTSGALGGKVIGFEYWRDPGAFAHDAMGTIGVLLQAGFSFQGTEIVGITAGEAKRPTKVVPRAIKNTFWRIIIFYICTIFLLGLCIPSNDPDLGDDNGTGAKASFTLVFSLAHIDAGAHVINAIVLTSVLSAANSALYTTARTLLGLSRDKNAPAFLGKVNRFGSPFWAVIVSSIIGFACVFVSIYSAEIAFQWFLSITAVSGFISWWGIAFVHIRFRRAYVRQGRDIKDLPYLAMGYPYSGIFASVLCVLIILGQVHKLVRKTKIVPLDEVDFETGRVTRFDIEKDAEEEENYTIWRQRACPTCHLPAIVKNLRKDPLHDTLVACVRKLKTKLINDSLTPLTLTFEAEPSVDRSTNIPASQNLNPTLPYPSVPETDDRFSPGDGPVVKKEEQSEFSFNDWSALESLPASLNCESLLDDMMVDNDACEQQQIESPIALDKNEHNTKPEMKEPHKTVLPQLNLPQKRSSSNISERVEVREKSAKLAKSDDQKWRCSRCLFPNIQNKSVCGVCRRPKDADKGVFEQPASTPSDDYCLSNTSDINHGKCTNVVPASQMDEMMVLDLYPGIQTVQLLCTGLNSHDTARFDRSIMLVTETDLSVDVYSDVRDMDEVGHVITSVDENRLCPRTLKYLHAILAGRWIVDASFDSIKAKRWLPEEPYEVLGDTTSGVTNAPAAGRQKRAANADRIFDHWKFYFFGDFSNKHKKSDLLQLCRSAGGKILARRPGSCKDVTTVERPPVIIVPSMEDSDMKNTSWLRQYRVKDAAWLIDSISGRLFSNT
ncbi:hypothetical protein DFQ29_000616 [Apophysomyces sp. BC1021]|nr:hypothetical protein DFQ29_000616 [Apophysomyces sp. BC1021]